ncbi:MAG: outer membrane beta-barrel protein [Flavobacteriaceae bacterium]|nr:outer membrane beta-barrel protein [Flavobacteriaceae bacterium]
MKKLFLLCFMITMSLSAQKDDILIDERYLEDQLYISLSYQQLMNLPDEIGQSGFSYSLSLGLIKDIPLNTQRNRGFGIGLGYNLNVHYFNVEDIGEEEVINEVKSNKVAMNMIEMPIESQV